jgi:hypothetical protein
MDIIGLVVGIAVAMWVMNFVIRQSCRMGDYSEERIHESQMESLFFGLVFALFGAGGGDMIGCGIAIHIEANSVLSNGMLTVAQILLPVVGSILGGLVGVAILGGLALLWFCLFWTAIKLDELVDNLIHGF